MKNGSAAVFSGFAFSGFACVAGRVVHVVRAPTTHKGSDQRCAAYPGSSGGIWRTRLCGS